MAEAELQVILKAMELAEHTLRLTSNCNHYPKKYRFSLVDKMQNKCLGIYESLMEANRTDIRDYKRDRLELQTRAITYCHVEAKEGRKAYKVADLSEFWRGQKNIVLLDPNLIACREWRDMLQQLIDSQAWVDFSQGVDIRLMTKEKAEMIKRIKTKNIHFAWDRYEDKDTILPKFKMFKEITKWDKRKLTVYVLTNFNTTTEQDLERIYTLREMGYWPYVMIYNKEHTKPTDTVRRIQRWVNMRAVFENVKRFENYK